MDTVEETNGYYFDGLHNLSTGELFFFVFVDEARKQLGVEDVVTLALIILGQPLKKTRTKPGNATKKTSYLSFWLRRVLNYESPVRLATLTSGSIQRRKFSYTKNLGAFTGRWIPVLGMGFVANDVAAIVWKATRRYNLIVSGDDKLW